MALTTDHYELHGWPKSRWRDGVFYGIRKLKCAWADRVALLTELNTDTWPYPDGMGAPAREVAMEPLPAKITGAGGMASYEYALLTVKYSTSGPIIVDQDLVEETLLPYGVEFYGDDDVLCWENENSDAFIEKGEVPKIWLHGLKYRLKFYDVAVIPGAVVSLIGHVNSNIVTSYTLGISFAPETLMYSGAVVFRRAQLGAALAWDVTYEFNYWPYGWNKFFRLESAQEGMNPFENLYAKGVGRFVRAPSTVF